MESSGETMTENTVCPHCAYDAECHETLDFENNPQDGDLSFCVHCGEVSMFKGSRLTKIDVLSLPSDTQKELHDLRIAWVKNRNLPISTNSVGDKSWKN
jgi:hypothetical protein